MARRQCVACHVAAPQQDTPPILKQPTPSFMEVANRQDTGVARLRRFLTTTHWDLSTLPVKMPDPHLTSEQIDAVSAYILSLRQA